VLREKYTGFKKLEGELAHKPGVTNPGALAASIGRKKYGAKKFNKAAHEHRKLKEDLEGIIDAALDGNAARVQELASSVLLQKIHDKIEELRPEVAQGMFLRNGSGSTVPTETPSGQ
jgi:hypothetical protein